MRNQTKQKYYEIYMLYTLANATEEQIAKKLGCSLTTIGRAIEWVSSQRLNFANETALQMALDAIRYRMQQLSEDLNKERKKEKPFANAVIGYQRELRAHQELLLKLQSLLIDKISLVDEEGKGIPIKEITIVREDGREETN